MITLLNNFFILDMVALGLVPPANPGNTEPHSSATSLVKQMGSKKMRVAKANKCQEYFYFSTLRATEHTG